ncbi:hypothetical protein MNEG_12394, partial [Monoraphidium neglectum]
MDVMSLLDLPSSALVAVLGHACPRSALALRLACRQLRAVVDAALQRRVCVGGLPGNLRADVVAPRFPRAQEVVLCGLAAADLPGSCAEGGPAGGAPQEPLQRILSELALLDDGAWGGIARIAGCPPSAPLLRLLAAAAPRLEALQVSGAGGLASSGGRGAGPGAAACEAALQALLPLAPTLTELTWHGFACGAPARGGGATAALAALTSLRRLRLRTAPDAGRAARALEAALGRLTALTHLSLEVGHESLEQDDWGRL